MKELIVQIPHHEYSVKIGQNILGSSLPKVVEQTKTDLVVAVTNTTIQKLYPYRIAQCLESMKIPVATCVLPDGEQYKSLQTLNTIYDFLLENQANRKTLLIAFGGGVIGDMAGFAAASFMRGIRFIQVPTTLLAQVDSSIGGKTGVNHALGKNTIGAFKQPDFVCMDLEFLRTLPARELNAGFFELIKHGLIHKAAMFHFLLSGQLDPLDLTFLEEAVYQSCQIKAHVVEQDEKETGLRATLNFGHSLGHLLETHTQYSKYLHGEAVGVGMLFATFVSSQLGFLKDEEYQKIIRYLRKFIVKIILPPLNKALFIQLLLHDKKSEYQSINFILIKGIGECFIQERMNPEELWALFNKFLTISPWACEVR